jgi:hypothetical protein
MEEALEPHGWMVNVLEKISFDRHRWPLEWLGLPILTLTVKIADI